MAIPSGNERVDTILALFIPQHPQRYSLLEQKPCGTPQRVWTALNDTTIAELLTLLAPTNAAWNQSLFTYQLEFLQTTTDRVLWYHVLQGIVTRDDWIAQAWSLTPLDTLLLSNPTILVLVDDAPENTDMMRRVLLYHVVQGIVTRDDLIAQAWSLTPLDTLLLSNQTMLVLVDDAPKNSDYDLVVLLWGLANSNVEHPPQVVQANQVASNGLIHDVHQVLLPRLPVAATAVAATVALQEFTILYQVLQDLDLVELLGSGIYPVCSHGSSLCRDTTRRLGLFASARTSRFVAVDHLVSCAPPTFHTIAIAQLSTRMVPANLASARLASAIRGR